MKLTELAELGGLMHEQEKLAEAEFFLSKMPPDVVDKDETFEFHLSAFLTAARSVLQYALEEAKSKPQGQSWYDGFMNSSSVLQFFKAQRDINIHVEPVKPRRHVHIVMRETIHLSESVTVEVKDKNGKIMHKSNLHDERPSTTHSVPETETNSEYRFSDWPGKENLITLAHLYVDELRNLIADGVTKGFITG